MKREHVSELIVEEMRAFAAARIAGDHATAWRALERIHIVSQPFFAPHLASHWSMLRFALGQRELGEVLGQCLRLRWCRWALSRVAFQPVTRGDRMSAHFVQCRSHRI